LLTYRTASRLGHTRTVSMDAAMTKLIVSVQRNIIARWLGF